MIFLAMHQWKVSLNLPSDSQVAKVLQFHRPPPPTPSTHLRHLPLVGYQGIPTVLIAGEVQVVPNINHPTGTGPLPLYRRPHRKQMRIQVKIHSLIARDVDLAKMVHQALILDTPRAQARLAPFHFPFPPLLPPLKQMVQMVLPNPTPCLLLPVLEPL